MSAAHEHPGSAAHGEHHPQASVYYVVFAALLVLLAVTVGVAQFDLGPLNFFVAALIATTKALLIMLFFMHVRYSPPLIWLVAFAGFAWLAILFAFTLADYLTR
ncbi:MAG TPA: cytochrome C oxidase subunit IV family protein [Pirellulaceae bacterium]|jgi:cytochrome c oxidase subunit IV|nr:cytochrome C oxidase subunit IV family protein [Pirellulaceae bacterium]